MKILNLCCGLLLGATLSAPANAAEFILGVATHFGLGIGEPTASMKAIENAGLTSFRDEIQWSKVEKTVGELKIPPEMAKVDKAIELAKAKGVEPLLILCYGNKLYGGGYPLSPEAKAAFVRYAEFMVQHYKGKVRYWELWNEWNGGLGNRKNIEGRAAGQYAELLKVVYPAVKRIDPNIVLLGGAVEGAGSTSWIEDLFDAGAGKYMDGLSVHPYVFHAGKGGTPERLHGWLNGLVKKLEGKSDGKDMPIYITEIGWPNAQREKGIPREVSRDYVARVLLSVRSVPQVKGLWWYNLQDYGNNSFVGSFGLLDKQGQPKPAYNALKDIAASIRKATSVERIRGDKDAWVLKLSGPDLKPTYAIWSPAKEDQRVRLRFKGPNAGATLSNGRLAGKAGEAVESTKREAGVSLNARSTPTLFDADSTDPGVQAVELED